MASRYTVQVLVDHALLRVDVEVVEPEIYEHFIQLLLAVDRANHPRLHQVLQHRRRFLPHRLGFRRQVLLGVVRVGAGRIRHRGALVVFGRGLGQLGFLLTLHLIEGPVVLVLERLRAHRERREAGELLLNLRVRDFLGVELLLGVADAHGFHARDVARLRAVGHPVQHMQNGRVVVFLGVAACADRNGRHERQRNEREKGDAKGAFGHVSPHNWLLSV